MVAAGKSRALPDMTIGMIFIHAVDEERLFARHARRHALFEIAAHAEVTVADGKHCFIGKRALLVKAVFGDRPFFGHKQNGHVAVNLSHRTSDFDRFYSFANLIIYIWYKISMVNSSTKKGAKCEHFAPIWLLFYKIFVIFARFVRVLAYNALKFALLSYVFFFR